MPEIPRVSALVSRTMEIHHQVRSDGRYICLQIPRLRPVTISWMIGRNLAFRQAAHATRPSL